jgi:hypothetical protein
MTTEQWLTMAAIGGVGLIIQIIVLAVGGTWKLSGIEKSLSATFSAALKEHREKVDEEIDRARREFGETVTALRAKITEVELWARDNFVRRDSFQEVTRGLANTLKDFKDELKAQMDRLDGKLDRLAERNDRRDAREDRRT